MTIIEVNEYSLIAMKDSEDPWSLSVGYINQKMHHQWNFSHADYIVFNDDNRNDIIHLADSISNRGMLILYFNDKIPESFKVGDKILIRLSGINN